MSDRLEILRATRLAVRRQADLQAQVGSQIERPPEPGDIFGVEETAGVGVEWAILARDPIDVRRLLAVPVDGGSLVGSGDLAVVEPASSGPLILRCRFGVWLDAELFDPAQRTAILGLDVTSRARDRWSQISEGLFSGSVLGREVDEDPEYQDWLDEVVAPARVAMAGGERAPQQPPGSGPRVRFDRRALLQLAAALLLVAAASVTGSWLWWRQGLENLASAGSMAEWQNRQEVSRLEAERDQLKADLQRFVEAGAASGNPYLERLAELERDLAAARRVADAFHPFVATLHPPKDPRTEVTSLRLPEEASHLVLVLPLEEPSVKSGYRAELLDEEGEATLWASQRLTPNASGEVTVGIPAERLDPGKYRVRLTPNESPGHPDYRPDRGSTAGSRLELLAPADYAVRVETP